VRPSPDRFVLAPSFEALFARGVGEQMTPGLREELRRVGVDLDRPLLPAYPLDTWMATLHVVARALHPDLPMGEAQRRIAASVVAGWEHTLVGKAMTTFARLLGPRQLLLRFGTLARASNTYGEMTVRELGPGHFELVLDPYVGWAEYAQGTFSAVLAVTGAPGARVDVVRHEPDAERLVLHVRW
jgi:uncharacterized protein (TIGR02265 family)